MNEIEQALNEAISEYEVQRLKIEDFSDRTAAGYDYKIERAEKALTALASLQGNEVASEALDFLHSLAVKLDDDCPHEGYEKLIQHAEKTIRAALQQGAWRPEVVAFANAMERKLKENDHKGGWKGFSYWSLFDRVVEEIHELKQVLHDYPKNTELVLDEAADVANMVMMVVDVTEGLE